MELTLVRSDLVATDGDIIGEMFFPDNAERFCWTLERTEVAIPVGRYRIRLTFSNRARLGTLWTPLPDFRLPEICNVPGRTGIRAHAANEARQLDGCVAVGDTHTAHTIAGSRHALTSFVNSLVVLEAASTNVWLTVSVPSTVHP